MSWWLQKFCIRQMCYITGVVIGDPLVLQYSIRYLWKKWNYTKLFSIADVHAMCRVGTENATLFFNHHMKFNLSNVNPTLTKKQAQSSVCPQNSRNLNSPDRHMLLLNASLHNYDLKYVFSDRVALFKMNHYVQPDFTALWDLTTTSIIISHVNHYLLLSRTTYELLRPRTRPRTYIWGGRPL